jgi:hypothetical protein
MSDEDSPQPGEETGAALTIAAAARAAGTDRHSIRRKLHAGGFPNAFKDAKGFWRIYESDLLAAAVPLVGSGDEADAPVAETPPAEPSAQTPPAEPSSGEEDESLRLEINDLRHRVATAEALLAAERRLSDELARALQVARRTGDALLASVAGPHNEPRAREPAPDPNAAPPQPQPRVNWQAGLRAARAREAAIRAARAREEQRRTPSGESGS